MAVSRRLRFEILRRDDYTCRYCGASAPDVKLTVDHVNPTALGGEDRPENLVTACDSCNGGKSSIPPDAGTVANVAADAVRWSAALRLAADEMLADLDRRDEIRSRFDAAWSGWGLGKGATRQPVPRPDDWAPSVDRFTAAGLPPEVLLDCIGTAMGNKRVRPEDTFRYMCGIAWKKVQQLQETARESLSAPGADREDRATDYEAMYRELGAHIIGTLPGVASDGDELVMALARGAGLGEDDDPEAFDVAGHAACEVVNRAAEVLYEYRDSAKVLLAPLPVETFQGFYDRAAEELNWPQRLTEVDGGRLYRLAITARMLLLCVREIADDPTRQEETD